MRKLYLAFLLLCLQGFGYAQSALLDVALIEPSVKANGMANAFTANNQDVFGFYYNPAQSSDTVQIGATYQKGYMEDNTGVIAAKIPTKVIDMGVSLYYYNTGDLDSGAQGATDMMVLLNLSRKIFGPLSLGVNGKYLHSSLFGDLTASTMMYDAGALLEFKYFNMGASVANINGSLNYGVEDEEIPTVTRVGILLHSDKDSVIGVAAGVDYVKVSSEAFIRAGGEVSFSNMVAGRGGYEYGDKGNNGFSMGIGLLLGQLQLDYAFTVYNQLKENVHKIGLIYKFESAKASYEKQQPAQRKNVTGNNNRYPQQQQQNRYRSAGGPYRY